MDYNGILTESRWKIIKEITKKESSATSIAKELGTSLANVSQQLRLLEAYQLVKKERKEKNNSPGKPKTIYTLDKEIAELTIISPEVTKRTSLELDDAQKLMLTIWLKVKKEDQYYLEKFLMCNREIIEKCPGIAISKKSKEKIELLLVTDHIDEIRQKYSNQKIKEGSNTKEIVCWTHSLAELKEGLLKHEEYFQNLVKELETLLDKDSVLEKVEAMKNGKNN